jgi:hypothetical protein
MARCAASTGVPRRHQRVRVAPASPGERTRQGRGNPRPPSPNHRAATPVGAGQAPVRAGRQGIAGSAPAPAPAVLLGELRLLVRPDTVLRWHRNLLARRHAAVSRPKNPGRPRTVGSIRALVLRLVRENPLRSLLRRRPESLSTPTTEGVQVRAAGAYLAEAGLVVGGDTTQWTINARQPPRSRKFGPDTDPDPTFVSA